MIGYLLDFVVNRYRKEELITHRTIDFTDDVCVLIF